MNYVYTVEPLYSGQLAVLYKEVDLHSSILFRTADSVLIREVTLIWSNTYREVPLYVCIMYDVVEAHATATNFL